MTTVTIEGEGSVEPEETPVEVEDIADAAVEIAEIEAERDITLAAINAEAERERMEMLRDERITTLETELSTCRTTISTLETELAETKAALSTPPILVEPEPLPNPEPLPLPAESIPSAAQDPVALDAPPAEPAKRKPRLRWI